MGRLSHLRLEELKATKIEVCDFYRCLSSLLFPLFVPVLVGEDILFLFCFMKVFYISCERVCAAAVPINCNEGHDAQGRRWSTAGARK